MKRTKLATQRGDGILTAIAVVFAFLIVGIGAVLLFSQLMAMRPAVNYTEKVAARASHNAALARTRPLVVKELNRKVMSIEQILNAGPGRGVEGSRFGVFGDRAAAGEMPFTAREVQTLLDCDFTINPLSLDPGPASFADPQAQRMWDEARFEFRNSNTMARVKVRTNSIRPIAAYGLADDPTLTPWVISLTVYVDQVTEELRDVTFVPTKPAVQPKREYTWRPTYGKEQGAPDNNTRLGNAVPDDPHCLAQGMAHRDGFHLVGDAFETGQTFCRYEANESAPPTAPVGVETGGRLVPRKDVMAGNQFKQVAAYNNGIMKSPGLVAPIVETELRKKNRYMSSYTFKCFVRLAKPDGTKAVEIPMPGDFNYVEPVPGTEPVMCGTHVSHPDIRNGEPEVDGTGALWSVITSCPGNNQNPDTGQVGGSLADIKNAKERAQQILITPPTYSVGKPTYKQTPNEWSGAVVPNTGSVSVPGTVGQSYIKLQVKYTDDIFESTPKFKRILAL